MTKTGKSLLGAAIAVVAFRLALALESKYHWFDEDPERIG